MSKIEIRKKVNFIWEIFSGVTTGQNLPYVIANINFDVDW